MSDDELKAIQDAKTYLEDVADDRMNASISWERRDQVIEILENLLMRFGQG